MVTACFDGTALTLQGHAGGAPFGQDLVCAAISGLAYALAQRVREWEEQGALARPPAISLQSGNARICADPRPGDRDRVLEDFQLVKSGLRLLQQHCPEQITVV